MMKLNRANAIHWNDRMLGLAMAIRGLPIPVIAMVHGHCMGGGHELALWCDLVISADDGVFGQSGARVGACPTVGATQYIPRLIGERLAKEMIFLCRTFSAEEAVQIGLINRVVPKAELKKATLDWCQKIKGYSGQTIRSTKKSLNFEFGIFTLLSNLICAFLILVIISLIGSTNVIIFNNSFLYQLDFVIPGILPCEAICLSAIRDILNFL